MISFTTVIFYSFAPAISNIVYKSKEAAEYIRILSPLVPIMYLDMITDGMLKGLDQQIYSMRYNIIDSSICVILVYLLLPIYAVKGYIIILYISELINFYLSFGRLTKICEIRFFQAPSGDISKLFQPKNSYIRERNVFQMLEVRIFRNDKAGIECVCKDHRRTQRTFVKRKADA